MEVNSFSEAWDYILHNTSLGNYTAIDFIAIAFITLIIGAFVISAIVEVVVNRCTEVSQETLDRIVVRISFILKVSDCPLNYDDIAMLVGLTDRQYKKLKSRIAPMINYHLYGCKQGYDPNDDLLDK